MSRLIRSPIQMTKKSPLQTFLDKYSTKGDVYNFTNMAAPFGKFDIPQDQLSKFVDVYIKTLKQGIVPVLTEKPGVAGPIVVDLDFKFLSESEERRYTLDTIVKVVAEYFYIIKQYIELNDENSKCYVTERDQPYVETKKNGTDIVKDGIHLIFPFIRCLAALKHLAREHVIAKCRQTFLDLGITNKPEDVVDRAVIESNNWFAYGAAKPGRQAYRLTHVFDAEMSEVPFTDSWDFVNLFSVAGTEENVVYIKEPIRDIPESSTRPARSPQPQTPAAARENVPECVQEVKFELLEKVVMALAAFRAVQFDDWKDIVWSINNISTDNRYTLKGRQLIHHFSAKAPNKYDEEDVERYLRNLHYRSDGKKFGTLVMLLKEDNPAVHTELFLKQKLSYSQVKQDFENTHFKVLLPTGFIVHNELGLHPKTKKQMFDDYENKYYYEPDAKGIIQKLPFLKRWVKDEDIRTYKKVDFLPPPEQCPDGTYNLYHGIRAETLTSDDTDIDLKPIFDLHSKLCGNDPAFIEYSLSWHAQLIQQPGKLSRVGLLWQSLEGAGKNLWLDWFGQKILGDEYYFTSTNIEDFFGTFAPGLKHKLLVNVNEVDSAGAHRYVERIKSTITDKTITFQAKHVMAVSLRNFARLVFSTNNRNVIKTSVSDRRFAAVQCDSSRCNDLSYFDPLTVMFQNDSYAKAFFDYLKDIDISSWNSAKRPMTKLYRDLRQASVPVMSLWLIDLLHSERNIRRVFAGELMNQLISWAKSHNLESEVTGVNHRTFSPQLQEYGGIICKRSAKGVVYTINPDGLREWLMRHNHLFQEQDFIDDSSDDDISDDET